PGEGRPSFRESTLHPHSEVVDSLDPGWGYMRFEPHPRVPSGVQDERSFLSCGVDVVIVLELGKGEEVMPVILPLTDEKTQILLQLLIHPFRLAIGLRMIL